MVVKFQADTTTPLEAIVNVKDAEFPRFKRFLAESTSHGSTGGYAEYVDSGSRELQKFKLTLGWDADAATHAALVTALTNETALAFSIQDPDGDEVISFSAFVEEIGRMGEKKGQFEAEVVIQPTGAPTIT